MKPILFNTDMVQAIIKEEKTQTRRVIKNLPKGLKRQDIGTIWCKSKVTKTCYGVGKMPYNIGDILYVRETFSIDITGNYVYKADELEWNKRIVDKWRPSIHMPKKAARIFIKVTDVRIERLQDITTDSIKAEGTNLENLSCYDEYRCAFQNLWNGTLNKDNYLKYGWDKNPWVWIIEFRKINKSEVKENE